MKKGTTHWPAELVKHYKLIHALMTLNFKRFWTRDQEELWSLKELYQTVCAMIIEGQIALSTYCPVVEILVNDVSAFEIQIQLLLRIKRKGHMKKNQLSGL